MTNEIQVGEYVRTKYGYIAKVTEIGHITWFDSTVFVVSGIPRYEMNKEEIDNLIVKHSFNIIDLIEVGDFINGWKVLDVWDGENKTFLTTSSDGYISKIYSIVTKEQFKAMEYKVGGEND